MGSEMCIRDSRRSPTSNSLQVTVEFRSLRIKISSTSNFLLLDSLFQSPASIWRWDRTKTRSISTTSTLRSVLASARARPATLLTSNGTLKVTRGGHFREVQLFFCTRVLIVCWFQGRLVMINSGASEILYFETPRGNRVNIRSEGNLELSNRSSKRADST